MKHLIFLTTFLIGCNEVPMPQLQVSYENSQTIDQCVRAELFKTCLETVPKGPDIVNKSDWSKIVENCGDAAQYQSVRIRKYIKPECRAN